MLWLKNFPTKEKRADTERASGYTYLRLPADHWMLSFKKENGCSLSLQSTGKHIWKVQSERSCSKRWVFIVNGCKTSIPQGRWKWQAGINVTWGSMVRTSSLQPAGNGLRHICHILFYTRGNFIIHVFSCNKKGIEYAWWIWVKFYPFPKKLRIILFFIKLSANGIKSPPIG